METFLLINKKLSHVKCWVHIILASMVRFGCSKPLFPRERPTLADMIVIFTAEAIATAIMLFIGCIGCVSGVSGHHPTLTHLSICFGIAVMLPVQCFAHISGSHLNPAVTFTAVLLGYLPWIYVPVYFIGQFIGAIIGYGCIMAVTPYKYIKPEGGRGLCVPAISSDLTVMQGLFVEFLITLVLVLVCCAVWDERNAVNMDSVSLRFGLAVAGLALASVNYTGTHMNPARSFAPTLLTGDWKGEQWVYFVTPMLSAFVGACGYRILFNAPLDRQTKGSAEAEEERACSL